MKTIINKFFLVSAVVMALTACSDFLDKEPLSQGTEAIVFKTPEHFEQAANALYNVIGWKNLDDKPSYDDIMDRGTDISGLGRRWFCTGRKLELGQALFPYPYLQYLVGKGRSL